MKPVLLWFAAAFAFAVMPAQWVGAAGAGVVGFFFGRALGRHHRKAQAHVRIEAKDVRIVRESDGVASHPGYQVRSHFHVAGASVQGEPYVHHGIAEDCPLCHDIGARES